MKCFWYGIFSKLKFIISSSVAEACNNSILLLGPRGSGKMAVCESETIGIQIALAFFRFSLWFHEIIFMILFMYELCAF